MQVKRERAGLAVSAVCFVGERAAGCNTAACELGVHSNSRILPEYYRNTRTGAPARRAPAAGAPEQMLQGHSAAFCVTRAFIVAFSQQLHA